MDGPQPYRRLEMPVQMIELEEVTMVETSDDALEAAVNAAKGFSVGLNSIPPSVC